jgi:hypothetical protein
MHAHRSTVCRLMLVNLFSLLLVCANVTAVAAQSSNADEICESATIEYTSWLDKLQSLYGAVSVVVNERGHQDSANAIFAIVNTGDVAQLDYFVQATLGANDYLVLLVKDNFVAVLERRSLGWDVEARAESYEVRNLEDSFFQADTFLKSAFKELRLLELSTCLGGEIVAGQETVRYRLDIPPMLASMLIRHLSGNPPNDVQFGEIGFDFWLDKKSGYLTKIEGVIEASQQGGQDRVALEVALELTSVDNVHLKVPEYIRILAMQRGLIEPDFVQEFIALDG